MTTSRPNLVARITLFAVLVTPVVSVYGQLPGGSSARDIPTAVQQSEEAVSKVITVAEDHFRKGKLNLEDNKRDQARDEFDRAVDSILESGLDVRASQRLNDYYLKLVESIYREEVPLNRAPVAVTSTELVAQNGNTATPQQPELAPVGFRDQKFEPSSLDELSKLVLTSEEQNVSSDDVLALEQAKQNINFPFTINPLIQGYINYYQGRGRSTMENGLRKSGQYMKLARQIFKEEGVPVDIAWLGQVESSWKVKAMSWASASGLWQFIPSTGRRFGLRQTAWIDERNSFEQATRASAKYLKFLANRYNGNWELAMGAYNTGEGNIDRGISRAGVSNFWAVYPYIAQETRNYVPNILATILIAKNPEKYGFKGIRPDAPMAYDVVQVQNSTSLQLVAEATDSSVDYVRSLNPELKRDVTPRGEAYNVRVPGGKGRQFHDLLKRIPAANRETARIISVAPGEDLQNVANRTGVSLTTLQAMNNGVDLKTTNKVVVPKSNVRLTLYRRSGATEAAGAALTKVRAKKGDTIGSIAAGRKLDPNEVARLNGISANVELRAGQEIKLPATAAAPPSRRH